MSVARLTSLTDYEALVAQNADKIIVLDFWANWCEPCIHMNQVVAQLAKSFGSIVFAEIEAEEVDDITEKFEVASVPSFVFVRRGEVIDREVGANAPSLAQKVEKWDKESSVAPQAAKVDINERLTQLVNHAPIMVFMKGVPQAPQCGFSSQIVTLLKDNSIPFSSFNILSDPEVRQGLKTFSDWPTYPQLYCCGKLVGGLDIVKEMVEDGELIENLQPGITRTQELQRSSQSSIDQRLHTLINHAPVMLFMKGTPDSPQCGFSNKMVGLLNDNGVRFSSFNILSDNDVRQGLKTYSNWPTYPQLYANGTLIGGLDIVKELIDEGEFLESLPDSCKA